MSGMSRLLLLLVGISSAWAAGAEPVVVSGQVVDVADQPLGGAEVWLIRSQPGRGMAAEANAGKADPEGRFSFPGVTTEPAQGGTATLLMLLAYREPCALGWLYLERPEQPVRVRCLPPQPLAGRVTNEAGAGLTGRVALTFAAIRTDEQSRRQFVYLSDDLSRRFSTPCDATGAFSVPWLPEGYSARFDVTAPGHARARWNAAPGGEATVKLGLAGRLDLAVSCPAQPGLVGGLPVLLAADDKRELSPLWRETDATGALCLDDLAPGKYAVVVQLPLTSEWQAPVLRGVEVKVGQTTALPCALQSAPTVTGRVVDKVTGQPVAGVSVYTAGEISYGHAEGVVSDAEGNYRFRALPGKVSVTVGGGAPDYVRESPSPQEVLVTAQGGTVPDIAIRPGKTLTGVVVDAEGKPVAGAEVFCRDNGPSESPAARTDEQGRFAIRGLDPRGEVPVWASSGERLTARALMVDASAATIAPLKLTVQTLAPVRLKVRVVDGEGQPPPGLRVSGERAIGWSGWPAAIGKPDASGVLLSGPLPALGKYRLTITAEGCDGAAPPAWEAVAGQTHDFGTVTLTRASGTIAGKVVDQEGKPRAGVTVFNSGDGPKLARATTDAEGRFRLAGLYPGRVLVFTAAPGCLFTGAVAAVGAEDVALRLLPRAATTVLGAPREARPRFSREQERQAARALILQAIPLAAEYQRDSLVAMLATVDLPEARKLATAFHTREDAIVIAVGKSLLETSPDQALTCLEALKYFEKVNDLDMYVLYQAYATAALAKRNPEQARRQFDKTLPLVQTLKQEQMQMMGLALLGKAMLPADRTAATTALRACQQLVSNKLGRTEEGAEMRAMIAPLLAVLDPDGALEMVQGLQGDRDRGETPEGGIAAAIAPTDPARAEQLLAGLSEEHRAAATLPVAYAMLAKDPERAKRLAHAIGREWERRRTLAWLAEGLRASDPAAAAGLFGEAVEGWPLEQPPSPEQATWQAIEAGRHYAELAFIGTRLGYPQCRELVWAALSCRATAEDPRHQYWSGLERTLGLLALADPELTREAVGVYAARRPTTPAGPDDYSRQDLDSALLAAMALADAPAVPAFAAALKLGTGAAYTKAVELLLAEPEARLVRITGDSGNWVPGWDRWDMIW